MLYLQQHMRTHLRISLSAITHNIKLLRGFTLPHTKVMAGALLLSVILGCVDHFVCILLLLTSAEASMKPCP